jgi:hypothetical protein
LTGPISPPIGRHNWDVQFGQRVALIEIVDAQNGQSFVVGAAVGSGLSTELLMRLTCFTSTNTAAATIRKLITSLMNWP